MQNQHRASIACGNSNLIFIYVNDSVKNHIIFINFKSLSTLR